MNLTTQLLGLPSEEAIIAAAQRLIQTTSTWKPGKTYHKTVKTYHRGKLPEDGAPWHCRVSEHNAKDGSFDLLWEKLGTVKEAHEKEYAPPARPPLCSSLCSQIHTQYPKGDESKGLVSHSSHLDNVLFVSASSIPTHIHGAQS